MNVREWKCVCVCVCVGGGGGGGGLLHNNSNTRYGVLHTLQP